MLTVLSVAYPLARVAPGTAGGAEQVLAQINRALVGRGERSIGNPAVHPGMARGGERHQEHWDRMLTAIREKIAEL